MRKRIQKKLLLRRSFRHQSAEERHYRRELFQLGRKLLAFGRWLTWFIDAEFAVQATAAAPPIPVAMPLGGQKTVLSARLASQFIASEPTRRHRGALQALDGAEAFLFAQRTGALGRLRTRALPALAEVRAVVARRQGVLDHFAKRGDRTGGAASTLYSWDKQVEDAVRLHLLPLFPMDPATLLVRPS